MITMNELVDLRMHQHLAHELYRQQIIQRIPDPFPAMLPVPIPRHIMLPPRVTLPGVEANLQNNDLWKQFHQIGTEMIITKSGRRMFPSMRLSLSGLEDDVNYCVLLEMVPIGDCRYKFSGSQWVPAGGAEPQSPQRIYLHADSPASGSHWQAQPILFNKVKLTNNTLDNNGHIVLTSMHKYQPRIHVIRTSDPTQIPWAPQQAFIFPETEFVAVTAYQNDRITKLKIDNNPFAKGFRETGQSRCKRKMNGSPQGSNEQIEHQTSKISQHESDGNYQGNNNNNFHKMNGKHSENISDDNDDIHYTQAVKRMRSNSSAGSISSLDEGGGYVRSCSSNSSDISSPGTPVTLDTGISGNHTRLSPPPSSISKRNEFLMHHIHQNMHSLINPSIIDLASTYLGRSPSTLSSPSVMQHHQQYNFHHQHHPSHVFSQHSSSINRFNSSSFICNSSQMNESSTILNGSSPVPGDVAPVVAPDSPSIQVKANNSNNDSMKIPRKSSFTISAILGADH